MTTASGMGSGSVSTSKRKVSRTETNPASLDLGRSGISHRIKTRSKEQGKALHETPTAFPEVLPRARACRPSCRHQGPGRASHFRATTEDGQACRSSVGTMCPDARFRCD